MRLAICGILAFGLFAEAGAGLLDEKPVGWASTSGGTDTFSTMKLAICR